jgi:hypothetical protein
MTKEDNFKLITIRPNDVSTSKTSDFAEKIISGILEYGELDVIGIGDAMFLSCAAINMATEIANVFVDEICIDSFEVPILGKINFVSSHLSQNKITDFDKLVKSEESEMKNPYEQTISIARDSSLEKLLTVSLMKLSRFDRLKIMAAGGAINDAILLALRLTKGRISKDPMGVGVINLYSINTRSDETKKIVAISIFVRKKAETQYSKSHNELLKKIKAGC